MAIFPLIIGIFALQKIEDANSSSELYGWDIAVLLCCSTLGGIFMLCIKDEELAENKTTTQTTQNAAKTDNEVQTKLSVEATSALLEAELSKVNSLHDKGILSDE